MTVHEPRSSARTVLTIVVDDDLAIIVDDAPDPPLDLDPMPEPRVPTDAGVPRPAAVGPATADVYVETVKPVIDRCLAGVLVVVCAPLFLVIGLAVALSPGGAVLFRQVRVGRDGAPFEMVKFRSMLPPSRADADGTVEERLARHKPQRDPRVTRVGRFLRATSLDELPQLLNVVRGEMSLVGPRPELPWIVASYDDAQHRRHRVRPGMTGSWQVEARGVAPMHESTGWDLHYVDTCSWRTDLAILVRTPRALLTGR